MSDKHDYRSTHRGFSIRYRSEAGRRLGLVVLEALR
jgi:hypothetical protein